MMIVMIDSLIDDDINMATEIKVKPSIWKSILGIIYIKLGKVKVGK